MSENTLRIGICDDEQEDLKRIEETVRESVERIGIPVSIVCRLFQSGEDMIEEAQREAFDLVFLDIEMPGVDGFQLAKRICTGRAEVCLIFVSAYESFVFDAQEYMPFWFVRKGMLERDSLLAIQKYFELTASKRINYRMKDGTGYRDLLLHDVLYIECRGHLLVLHKTDRKTYQQYGSLKSLEEELSKHNFLRIHKSYLVNQEYIEEIGKREVRLTEGTLLELGRDRRKSLCEAMRQYEREHYGFQRICH